MKKTAVRIYVAAFLMILCLPWLFWGLFKGYFDSENHENRKLKERPSLTAETYETFFKDYEEYYNDNIPFRNPLISLNTGLDYFLFKTSSNQNVIIGKDMMRMMGILLPATGARTFLRRKNFSRLLKIVSISGMS